VECALAVREACGPLALVQVVQSGTFLTGNLAAEHLRSFNVVGALDWAATQMLGISPGDRGHVLVTSQDWASVRYKYWCLPIERVVVDGHPRTVYSVVAPHTVSPAGPSAEEWLYELAQFHTDSLTPVEDCWMAFTRGQYREAATRAADLKGFPPWYTSHLNQLIERATDRDLPVPMKRLETLAWCDPDRIPSAPHPPSPPLLRLAALLPLPRPP